MSLTAVQISVLNAQFFLAAAGTLSFAILFACPRRCLPYCALVGAVGWLWYELLTLLGADAATASLLAVIPLTILTRVFAITQKTPVTVFLLTGIFPLVPGAGIYYTAYYFIQNENALALAKGISTFKIAVALAIGISLVLLRAAAEKAEIICRFPSYLYKGVISMNAMELLTTRRTYRRFAQKTVPQDVVDDIVQAVRLSSCGANRQAVRLVLVQSPEMVAKVQPLVKWAGYLPPEQGTPKADELPTFYAAVVQDTAIPGDLATDTGIALANMTLAAWDKGVGSCIMGAINKPALTTLLGIEEPQKLAFMVAFGYPTHKASIVPMTEQTGVKYYLDENRDYCVPKRSAEEIARSL